MSGRKNNLLSYVTIANGDMSQASLTSKASNINYLDEIGLQFNWTGSPVGAFAAQISADYAQDDQGNVTNPGNWVPLTFTYWNGTVFITDFSIPTSVGSPIYLDLALLSAPWIRSVYTRISGSGTLTAIITAKQL